jgi:hypothetical protein
MEGQAFSPSYDLPHPLPLPVLQVVPLSQSFFMFSVELTDRGEGEWGRSQIIWQRESLVFCKSFNTLLPKHDISTDKEYIPFHYVSTENKGSLALKGQ